MPATRSRNYTDPAEALAAMATLTGFGIDALLSGAPDSGEYVVTVVTPALRLAADDPQPHEDDFQESRQWDDGGAAGLGYRRPHSLNDPD